MCLVRGASGNQWLVWDHLGITLLSPEFPLPGMKKGMRGILLHNLSGLHCWVEYCQHSVFQSENLLGSYFR